jgi:hypothetical protein
LKAKAWKIIYQANGNLRQDWISILISYKVDFSPQLSQNRQRRSLDTNKGNNKARRYNDFINICAMNIGSPIIITQSHNISNTHKKGQIGPDKK